MPVKHINRMHGLTLIELLATIALTCVFLLSLGYVFSQFNKQFLKQQQKHLLMQNANNALAMLRLDMQMQGYNSDHKPLQINGCNSSWCVIKQNNDLIFGYVYKQESIANISYYTNIVYLFDHNANKLLRCEKTTTQIMTKKQLSQIQSTFNTRCHNIFYSPSVIVKDFQVSKQQYLKVLITLEHTSAQKIMHQQELIIAPRN